MKRIGEIVLPAAVCLTLILCAPARAQVRMTMYVQQGAADEAQIAGMLGLLSQKQPQVQWTAVTQPQIRDRMEQDEAPQLYIGPPQPMRMWAEADMLQPLENLKGSRQLNERVMDSCRQGERIFMAPLYAEHKQAAVNRTMLERVGLGQMADATDRPVWYPQEFLQLMEALDEEGMQTMDIWIPEEGEGGALETLVRTLYGSMLLDEQGQPSVEDNRELAAGIEWVCEVWDAGWIGRTDDRETALQRFARGETAVFYDWTPQDARRFGPQMERQGAELYEMPFVSAVGRPTRMFELVGVSAIAGSGEKTDELARDAAICLYENAGMIFGRRMIGDDGTKWVAGARTDARERMMQDALSRAILRIRQEKMTKKQALHLMQEETMLQVLGE